MTDKKKEPSKIEKWFEDHELAIIIVTGVLFFSFLTVMLAQEDIRRIDERAQVREERILSKTDFLTSESFEQMNIIGAEHERRIGSSLFDVPEDIFDLYMVVTSEGEMQRLAVYDTAVDGHYYVQPYDEAIGE